MLRIAIHEGLTDEDNVKLHLQELKVIDEKWLEAQQNLKYYQTCLWRAFKKKVHLWSFQVGDIIFAIHRSIITTHKTGNKFT